MGEHILYGWHTTSSNIGDLWKDKDLKYVYTRDVEKHVCVVGSRAGGVLMLGISP